jgi:hypothetical protein
MQPSRIPGLLSCGNWVKDAMDENRRLVKVILIGTPQDTGWNIPVNYQERVYLLDREEIRRIIAGGKADCPKRPRLHFHRQRCTEYSLCRNQLGSRYTYPTGIATDPLPPVNTDTRHRH